MTMFNPGDSANCAGIDTNYFYLPDKDDPSVDPDEYYLSETTLKRICNACPVINECLSYAVRHEHHGFWGGMTSGERRQYRQKHRIAFEGEPYTVTHWQEMIRKMNGTDQEHQTRKARQQRQAVA